MHSIWIPASFLVIPIAGYLLGSIPFGYLIVRLSGGGDVRRRGSGNHLLITVDTMAARCAGALGHLVWIMVPHSPTGSGTSAAITHTGIRQLGCFARRLRGTGPMSSM